MPSGDIRAALGANLTAENIQIEDEYFRGPGRASYERPYGWAWLLKLHEELYLWDDPDAAKWFDALRPLAETVARKYLDFFPKQRYPVRVGTHFNTAFGLAFAHDYAATLTREGVRGSKDLSGTTLEIPRVEGTRRRARAHVLRGGQGLPRGVGAGRRRLSLSGSDGGGLDAARAGRYGVRALVRRVPAVRRRRPTGELLAPADVTDRSDPKIVHLDGLNLSRAWCMRSVAAALPHDAPAREVLARAAERHAAATLAHVTSGDYAGEHWLATFAVYLLSTPTP